MQSASQPVSGRVLEVHEARGCVNRAQQPVRLQRTVTLLERSDGTRFLLSRAGNDDALAVDNQHPVAGDMAFQVTVAAAGRRPVLHDYRLPKDGSRAHFVLTDVYSQRSTDVGFIATPGRPSVACWLERVGAQPSPPAPQVSKEPEPPERDEAPGESAPTKPTERAP